MSQVKHSASTAKSSPTRSSYTQGSTPPPPQSGEPTLPRSVQTYLDTAAAEGGRNRALFAAACQMRDIAATESAALETLLPRALADGLPDGEIRHAIRQAYTVAPRPAPAGKGTARPASPPLTRALPPANGSGAQRVQNVAASVHEARRIPLPDAMADGFKALLLAAFKEGEGVCIGGTRENDADGTRAPERGVTLTREQWLERIAARKGSIDKVMSTKHGLFLRVNPMTVGGKGADADVAAFRHVLVEFDKDGEGKDVPKELQLGAILHTGLPIAAILDSGNKSVHAWVRVDAKDATEYAARVEQVYALFDAAALDVANRNPSRYSRCPDGWRTERGEQRRQSLLALNLGADSWAAWGKANETTPLVECEVLPPEPEFPLWALPEVAREFVTESARANSVTVGLVAACALGVASGSLGSQRVNSLRGFTTPANIMVFAFADSGTGKSNAYKACMKPFEAMHQEMQGLHRELELPNAKAEKSMLSAEMKALERSEARCATKAMENKPAKSVMEDQTPAEFAKPDREALKKKRAELEAKLQDVEKMMQPPIYTLSDATTPKLISILCAGDGQLFCASSDAKAVVEGLLGKHTDGITDEEVLLKGYSGERMDKHRTSTGSEETPEIHIAGLWFTQPDKLARLLASGSLTEGGMLPRLLMLHANCPPLRDDLNELGIAPGKQSAWDGLVKALFKNVRLQKERPVIDCDLNAREALRDYHNSIADRRMWELHDMTSFAARWGENAWRLALVIRGMRLGIEANNGALPLTLEDAQAGIAIMEWFTAQQLEILEEGRKSGKSELHKKVLKLAGEQGQLVRGDLCLKRIVPRGKLDEASALLEEVEATGKLRHEDRPTKRANHTSRVYLVTALA